MTAAQAFNDERIVRMLESVRRGDFAAANREVASGASVNAVGKDGISPLLWLMGEAPRDTKKIEYLLDKGADPNYREPKLNASAL